MMPARQQAAAAALFVHNNEGRRRVAASVRVGICFIELSLRGVEWSVAASRIVHHLFGVKIFIKIYAGF